MAPEPRRIRIIRRRSDEFVEGIVGDRQMHRANLPRREDLPRREVALIPQHRMGPFDVCSICQEWPADLWIDCCEHHFCEDCVGELSQERVDREDGFRLRASVCPYCRQEFLIAFPLQNPAQLENQ
jgi:hypothetical protein